MGKSVMDMFDRVPGRTIPVSVELTWFKQYYPRIAFLMTLAVGIGVGSYLTFILGPEREGLKLAGLLIMIIMPIAGLFTSFVISSVLQRASWPVLLFKDGVEFHQFIFDRLIRRSAFVPVSDLAKVVVIRYVDTRSSEQAPNAPHLSFVTVKKASYWVGQRAEHDVEQALEYIRKEWPTVQVTEETISTVDGRRVAVPEPTVSTPGKARKVPVQPSYAPTPPVAYEPRPAQSSYQAPVPQAPTMSFCPSCGAGVISGARFCPACGHQFGPSVHRPGMPMEAGKSTHVALLLSLLPGLAGVLGLGHFYVHKYAKGAFLLIIGLFFAGMGFVSLLMLVDPTYVWSAGALFVALFFNLLFLMMLAYSVIDARRLAGQFNMGTR